MKRRRQGREKQKGKFTSRFVLLIKWNCQHYFVCVSFPLFVLVNVKKRSLSICGNFESLLVLRVPRIVFLITQSLKHMDHFVRATGEKKHFQVSFQPITAQRDHCCGGENCTQKDSLDVGLICVDFSCRFCLNCGALDQKKKSLLGLYWCKARCSWIFAGDFEGKKRKNIRGKGWKSHWTCTLMGEQIPSKLARADGSSMLHWSTARLEKWYEELKRETRELDIKKGRGEKRERIGRVIYGALHFVSFISRCVCGVILLTFKPPSLVTSALSVLLSHLHPPHLQQNFFYEQ